MFLRYRAISGRGTDSEWTIGVVHGVGGGVIMRILPIDLE